MNLCNNSCRSKTASKMLFRQVRHVFTRPSIAFNYPPRKLPGGLYRDTISGWFCADMYKRENFATYKTAAAVLFNSNDSNGGMDPTIDTTTAPDHHPHMNVKDSTTQLQANQSDNVVGQRDAGEKPSKEKRLKNTFAKPTNRAYPDGTQRIGYFVDGKLQGQGVQIDRDGHRLEGEFRGGKIYHGTGSLRYLDGGVCEGRWVEGRFVGEGKRTFADGSQHIGTFVDGKLHGQGVMTHPDGHRLEGEFRDGKIFNGMGSIRFANGVIDEGEWKEGRLVGEGRRTLKNGVKLVGTFLSGQLHGRGAMTHPDGLHWEGEFRDGKIYNGKGSMRHPSGGVDEGSWVDGQFTGEGKRSFVDGLQYVGTFRNGKLNGHGTITFPNGTQQMGTFVDGKLQGQGVMTLSDGRRVEGEFNEGILKHSGRQPQWDRKEVPGRDGTEGDSVCPDK